MKPVLAWKPVLVWAAAVIAGVFLMGWHFTAIYGTLFAVVYVARALYDRRRESRPTADVYDANPYSSPPGQT